MLNLLPPEIKSRHKVRSKLYSIAVIYIFIAAVFVLGPIALSTYNHAQSSQISDYDSQISQIKTQAGQSRDLNEKLSFLEDRSKSAAAHQEQRTYTSYLLTIANSTPAPVLVTTIQLEDGSAATPAFIVKGTSADRRSIILFKDKISQATDFTGAVFDSLTETVEETTKTFAFSMKVTFAK